MPSVRTLGLVIRSVDVFETSRVLTFFTRSLGKVDALAKGARRLKGPYQSALDQLSVCDIVLLHKSTEALDLVTEAVLAERFDAPRRELGAFYAAQHIAELLHELTHPHDPHPRLFDAALVTLRHLDDGNLRPWRLVRFELACLREVGLMPALDRCVHCGQLLPAADPSTVVALGMDPAGLVCQACRPGEAHVTMVSSTTLEALGWLSSPGDSWRRLVERPEQLVEVRETVTALVGHVIGRRPRLARYLLG
jgi:DNA repair protein RecO (recombination protein O)